MALKIMIIAGEASGDLHGGKLVAALRAQDPAVEIFGVGGNQMQAAGMPLFYHVNQLAYVGLVEVVRHYFFFRRVFNRLIKEIKARQPDLLVLIDYPGFNLRFAKAAHGLGIKTFYYIAPQVWAWHEKRAAKMAGFIDEMAVILDFEVPFFQRYGIRTHFVGHPLLEGLQPKSSRQSFLNQHGLNPDQPLVAFLPGSRRQEVLSLLPAMLQTARQLAQEHPQMQFAVAQAATVPEAAYRDLLGVSANIRLIEDATYDLLSVASAALVASGTATLEAACFQVPFAIVYKVAPLTFTVGKRLVKIPHIGLVNVVAGKKLVHEFLQNEVTAGNLVLELKRLLYDHPLRKTLYHELQQVRQKLGAPGASAKTAQLILQLAQGDRNHRHLETAPNPH